MGNLPIGYGAALRQHQTDKAAIFGWAGEGRRAGDTEVAPGMFAEQSRYGRLAHAPGRRGPVARVRNGGRFRVVNPCPQMVSIRGA